MGSVGSYRSLKKSGEFSVIYKVANKWHCNGAVVFYKISDEKKVGFTAGKKVGNAVLRNRAKRRLRAIFAQIEQKLKDGIYVFVAKEGLKNMDYKQLKSSLLWSFKRLECFK
ncbi:MAG: ribonuclease P protein component [Campylobacteraceae bacterium]|nr:ribonuclease P protein component [Campylobacteraceae bacterium]